MKVSYGFLSSDIPNTSVDYKIYSVHKTGRGRVGWGQFGGSFPGDFD